MMQIAQELIGLSDEELLASVARGGDDAFGVLVARHETALYRFVLRSMGDASLAADIVQETFVRVWFKAANFQASRASVRTWIFAIAIHILRDEIRRRRRSILWFDFSFFRSGETGDAEGAIPDGAPSPEARAEKRELLDRLESAITQLPEKLRLPLVLCMLEGMPQAEAAKLLGTTRKSVELRIRRAKEKLCRILS